MSNAAHRPQLTLLKVHIGLCTHMLVVNESRPLSVNIFRSLIGTAIYANNLFQGISTDQIAWYGLWRGISTNAFCDENKQTFKLNKKQQNTSILNTNKIILIWRGVNRRYGGQSHRWLCWWHVWLKWLSPSWNSNARAQKRIWMF